MNNQKDTQKTTANTSPLGSALARLNAQNALDSGVYEFANKKTEKLVTALYLVSDCMETDDALKGKLRLLGVELLSDIYKLSTLSPIEKQNYISVSLTHIYELLSFIEIAYTIGFISEMNTDILKKEFSLLASDLKSSLTKDKHFTFTLDEKMFELPELSVRQGLAQESFVKDIPRYNADKRTSSNTMSVINNKNSLQAFQPKKTISHLVNLADRQDRINKIIFIIKGISAQAGKNDVSIKDVSLAFTDCSEKTIQRELNSLVLKGQLKRTGAKRWSRYAVI